MEKLITGIHHVTAIASDVYRNIEFYKNVLGLRMVKQTVNFDAPDVYHFYYGDYTGSPGTIITFFPYPGLVKGRHGKGFMNTTAFSVAYDSIDFWLDRLKRHNIIFKDPQERFSREVVVYFEDRDGLGLELVFNENDTRVSHIEGSIPVEHAIKGLHNAEIWLDAVEKTASVLTGPLNHMLLSEGGNRFRYGVSNSPGCYVDLVCTPESVAGRSGSGIVHHIAFSTPDQPSQLKVSEGVAVTLQPTEVRDRKYFSSIYFREPGGVLFEIATATPGFGVDEEVVDLGYHLQLPSWLEARRDELKAKLPSLA